MDKAYKLLLLPLSKPNESSHMEKQAIQHHFDQNAPQRSRWFWQHYLYHSQIVEVCRLFLNAESRVLELGCSTGDLLYALNPAHGIGVDISPKSIEIAQKNYPQFEFICADVDHLPDDPRLEQPFDLIIMSDLAGYLHDVQGTLEALHKYTHPQTRIVISVWNWLWQPILQAGEKLHLKAPDLDVRQNWISVTTLKIFFELTKYEMIQTFPGIILPYEIPGLTPLVNALANTPVIQRLSLLHTVVARPARAVEPTEYSVSVIIPSRNEVGNIAALIERVPDMGSHTELIFVDGNSSDGTVEEIQRQIALHPERDIKFMHQIPPRHPDADTPPNQMLKLGKGDAVRKGFDIASGDILMILDSDVSVLPEDLPRFYDVLAHGTARFANGTRFVYVQQAGAMKPLNRFGNVFFSQVFSWLLGQRISDTLCGTKVLFKADYDQIAANRNYFGEFDPFGDFDLLFGAAWLGHKIIDVPVRYQARTYGSSKVSVRTHGPLLGKMSLVGLWQFKIRPFIPGTQQPKSVPATAATLPAAKTGRNPLGWSLLIGLLALLWWWSRRR
jgi:glycosyltransferase involved in cell wall biosynthesis/SAM-dependent methyltransferase